MDKDDEIIQDLYEALRKTPRMREPEDTRKRAAFLLAHKMIGKAREYLEEVYRKDDERDALAAGLREMVSGAIGPFVFGPVNGALYRRVKEVVDEFIADRPEPDYLMVDTSETTEEDVKAGRLQVRLRIDPKKAPPIVLERWRRLMELQEEPPHEPDPLAYGEASPGVGWM